MSKVKNVTSEAGVLTALDEMSNLITEYQKENFKFLSGESVASVQSGQIKPDEQGRFIKSAINWFKDWLEKNKHSTEFENDQLGMVIIAPAGIKSAMSHKPRPIDVQALPVLPHVIKKARVISITKDDTGKPIENIILAAPIVVDGQRCYIVIRLRKYYEIKGEAPRYYTQAVAIETNTATSNQTEHLGDKSLTRFGERGGRDRLLNVLHDALNVNIEQKSKKIKVYGWKAIEMARNLTFEQLEILTLKTQKEHFIPNEQRTNIYLYDQKGRKKLDVLSWAVHHKLEEFKNNPNENDKPLDHEDLLRIRNEFQVDYEQGAFDGVDGFDSIDEDGQWVLDKIDSMIAVLQNLHGGENKVLKGRSNNVKTAKGTKVSTLFAVLEADQVIASHTATGAENPNYPQELQPRDRSRESSQAWVQKTSNTLDPESLGRSGRADTGAPIVGDDLVVESGNGRTMAIQLAYERGNADEYKEWLIDEAEYFGFSADQINQFKQPILVRIRTSEIDRIQFTVEANQDDKLSFSATERAKTDARRLDENLLSLFTPGEDGDLITASNQKFIQGFLKSLGETEAAQYIGTDGKPTQALVTRMKAAIFSKAYNDDRLLEMMADQTKPDLQNMLNALGAAAPKFIEAQAVSRGDVQDVSSSIVDGIEQALDKRVTNAIIDAANTILAAKQNDQDIVEFVKQQGLFGDLGEGVPELAVFLSKNSRSAKKMSLLFKAMAAFAEKQAIDGQNMGLFGEPEPVSIKDAINYAVNVIEDNYGDNANLSMFDSIDSLTSIDEKAHAAATSPHNDLDFPTAEQKQSGEYQKGHLSIGDLKIAIENPAGSIRSGTDPNGNEWQITMKHHYGFIKNTTGADGDEIDVFVKNHLAVEPKCAYIIKQLDNNGQFDEQKVIIGADSEEEAKEIYLSNYEKGWQGFGGIKKISMVDLLKKIQHTWSEFDSWARDGSYDHIPIDQVIIENAPKIVESKIDKEDPIVVLETLGKYHLVIGLDRIMLAKQRHERFIPAIIFDGKDISKSIIQNAIKQAGSKVDPVALAALILDELEKSLVNSFDDISNPVLEVLYQNL
ncbi:hypothetical protein KSB07_03205 [Acinetobacter junii]|uniref:LPD3 domain-containing protein n=1 Tax=Acinetobacter junii TaxID=40215 RepID=UPI001F31ECCD|nr:hypothetical protein [Acinetobacter junii]MCE6003367.1 hypothetical protein [Acinetobacter junii]